MGFRDAQSAIKEHPTTKNPLLDDLFREIVTIKQETASINLKIELQAEQLETHGEKLRLSQTEVVILKSDLEDVNKQLDFVQDQAKGGIEDSLHSPRMS